MTAEDRDYLDRHKKTDKEWALLRNEPNVSVLTIDDLIGVPDRIKKILKPEHMPRPAAARRTCSGTLHVAVFDKNRTIN